MMLSSESVLLAKTSPAINHGYAVSAATALLTQHQQTRDMAKTPSTGSDTSSTATPTSPTTGGYRSETDSPSIVGLVNQMLKVVPPFTTDVGAGVGVDADSPMDTAADEDTTSGGVQQCTCPECGKVFNSVWYLKQHAVKHSNDRPFKCKWCSKTYKFRSNLYQHKCPNRVRQPAGRRSKKFNSTNLTLLDPSDVISGRNESPAHTHSSLNDAMLDIPIHSGDYSHSMPHKSHSLHTPSSNAQRTNGDSGKTVPASAYKVPQNNNNNNHRETLLNDLRRSVERRSMENSGQLPRPTYPRTFEDTSRRRSSDPAVLADQVGLNKADVERYIERFRNMLHQCHKCKLYFPSREYLSRHMASHSFNDSAHKCRWCSEVFDTERQYLQHRTSHLPNASQPCPICGGLFRSRLSLRKHLQASCTCRRERPSPSGTPDNPLSFIDRSPQRRHDADEGDLDAAKPTLLHATNGCDERTDESSSSPQNDDAGGVFESSGDCCSNSPGSGIDNRSASSTTTSHDPSPANSVELGAAFEQQSTTAANDNGNGGVGGQTAGDHQQAATDGVKAASHPGTGTMHGSSSQDGNKGAGRSMGAPFLSNPPSFRPTEAPFLPAPSHLPQFPSTSSFDNSSYSAHPWYNNDAHLTGNQYDFGRSAYRSYPTVWGSGGGTAVEYGNTGVHTSSIFDSLIDSNTSHFYGTQYRPILPRTGGAVGGMLNAGNIGGVAVEAECQYLNGLFGGPTMATINKPYLESNRTAFNYDTAYDYMHYNSAHSALTGVDAMLPTECSATSDAISPPPPPFDTATFTAVQQHQQQTQAVLNDGDVQQDVGEHEGPPTADNDDVIQRHTLQPLSNLGQPHNDDGGLCEQGTDDGMRPASAYEHQENMESLGEAHRNWRSDGEIFETYLQTPSAEQLMNFYREGLPLEQGVGEPPSYEQVMDERRRRALEPPRLRADDAAGGRLSVEAETRDANEEGDDADGGVLPRSIAFSQLGITFVVDAKKTRKPARQAAVLDATTNYDATMSEEIDGSSQPTDDILDDGIVFVEKKLPKQKKTKDLLRKHRLLKRKLTNDGHSATVNIITVDGEGAASMASQSDGLPVAKRRISHVAVETPSASTETITTEAPVSAGSLLPPLSTSVSNESVTTAVSGTADNTSGDDHLIIDLGNGVVNEKKKKRKYERKKNKPKNTSEDGECAEGLRLMNAGTSKESETAAAAEADDDGAAGQQKWCLALSLCSPARRGGRPLTLPKVPDPTDGAWPCPLPACAKRTTTRRRLKHHISLHSKGYAAAAAADDARRETEREPPLDDDTAESRRLDDAYMNE